MLKSLKNNLIYSIIFVLIVLIILGLFGGGFWMLTRFSGSAYFTNIRTWVVTTAATTTSHQWISNLVASDAEIKTILENNKVLQLDPNDIAAISIIKSADDKYKAAGWKKLENGIFEKYVKGTTYDGQLMLVTDPSRISVAHTDSMGSQGETVVNMVKKSGAIAGINGSTFQDGANYDSAGGVPVGFIIENGVAVYGKNTKKAYSMVGFNEENKIVIGYYSVTKALSLGVKSAVCAEVPLISDGKIAESVGNGGWGNAPRSAIGQMKTGEVVLCTLNGRSVQYIGADIDQLAKVLYDNGVYNAMMLDGGSSTVMVYNGNFLNTPCLGHERLIPSAWIVMP